MIAIPSSLVVRKKFHYSRIQSSNDLPLATDESVKPVPFGDDTSLIVMDKNSDILDAKLSLNLQIVDDCFKSYYLLIS
jgi:hypothetical protein